MDFSLTSPTVSTVNNAPVPNGHTIHIEVTCLGGGHATSNGSFSYTDNSDTLYRPDDTYIDTATGWIEMDSAGGGQGDDAVKCSHRWGHIGAAAVAVWSRRKPL